jgi:hypothetical protein
MGKTKMENEVWQEVFGDWGKTRAKRQGTKKGKQFVKQPKGIAKKTAKYRRYS